MSQAARTFVLGPAWAVAAVALVACGGSGGGPDGGSTDGGGTAPSFPQCAEGWWTSYPGSCSAAVQCTNATGDTATACSASDCKTFAFTGYLAPVNPSGPYVKGGAVWSSNARIFAPNGVSNGTWTPVPPDTVSLNFGGSTNYSAQARCTGSGIDNGGGGLYPTGNASLDVALSQHADGGSWSVFRY